MACSPAISATDQALQVRKTWNPALALKSPIPRLQLSVLLWVWLLVLGSGGSQASEADTGAVQLEMDEFTMRLADVHGDVRTVLRGERMLRMADSRPDRIEKAWLELFDDVGLLWVWTAPSGEHYSAERAVFLSEPIGYRLPRPEQPALRIEGIDARILLDSRLVTTEQRVTVDHAGVSTTGIGMRANLDGHRVDWFSEVETEFRPGVEPKAIETGVHR
jgi:LPS export ABC transporter protein LptC